MDAASRALAAHRAPASRVRPYDEPADALVLPDRVPVGRLLPAGGLRLRRRRAAAVPRARRARPQTMFERSARRGTATRCGWSSPAAATFAAFPAWYATMFSGFYIALLLVLVCLIVRVRLVRVADQERERRAGARPGAGRTRWGASARRSSGASALANLLHGVPLDSSRNFAGTFWDLFRPYTVFAGVVVVLLFAFHGATFLTLRTMGELCERLPAPPGGSRCRGARGDRRCSLDGGRRRRKQRQARAPAGRACGARRSSRSRSPRCSCICAAAACAFAMTASATVLLVATIFTGLYPRVLVSRRTSRQQPDGEPTRPPRTTRWR